jgi:hypothetical protein
MSKKVILAIILLMAGIIFWKLPIQAGLTYYLKHKGVLDEHNPTLIRQSARVPGPHDMDVLSVSEFLDHALNDLKEQEKSALVFSGKEKDWLPKRVQEAIAKLEEAIKLWNEKSGKGQTGYYPTPSDALISRIDAITVFLNDEIINSMKKPGAMLDKRSVDFIDRIEEIMNLLARAKRIVSERHPQY